VISESTSIRLRTQLDCLPLLFAGIAAAAIQRRPETGKWSARENLAHLARYHEVFRERLERILREDGPQLARYRAEDDPEWPKWAAMTASQIMQKLQQLRSELIGLVQQLSARELARIGIHSRFGAMNMPLWIEFFLLHEAHHLYVVMQRVREPEGSLK